MEKLNDIFFLKSSSSSESKETAVDALKNIGKSADNIVKQFGKGFAGTIHVIYIFFKKPVYNFLVYPKHWLSIINLTQLCDL